MRRGACPTLAAPMATGDGLLARLMIAEMTAPELARLAAVARRLGNGLVEVTARGSVQLRGLTAASAAALPQALADARIAVAEGMPVLTGPLAGVDPAEVADPRPMAAALRAEAAGLALHPKVAAVVDGGGCLSLAGVPADLRLVAVPGRRWRVVVGDARDLGDLAAPEALAEAAAVLRALAAAGRCGRELAGGARARPAVGAIGRIGPARGLGLPFGQADATMLAALAGLLGEARVRPAPGRALVVVGAADDAALAAGAAGLGFVVAADDPRRAVVACSGAPGCGAAHLATRRLAPALVGVAGDWTLHLSGCSKRCAQPAAPSVTIEGTAGGWRLSGEGMAVPGGLAQRLAPILGRAG